MTGEFAAIERFRRRLPGPPPGELWIGDDAAVVASPGDPWSVLAADAVVAGVHADLGLTSLADLGWKAMAVNLSDLAAMGAQPRHALVSIVAPAGTDLDAVYDGLAAASAAWGCPVVGGDLSAGPGLVVSVAVTGSCPQPPVRRSGARPGDRLWVTGPLGASAAALRLLRSGAPAGDPRVLPHARPRALLAEGVAAREAGATAMIDVSDGLGADLGHLADASQVGVELHHLPVAPGATPEEAVGGGEDYQLIFAAPDEGAVERAFADLRPPIAVGWCVAERTVRTLDGRPLPPAGWSHAL